MGNQRGKYPLWDQSLKIHPNILAQYPVNCQGTKWQKTSFWFDKWLGGMSLKDRFPDIFTLAKHQQKAVAEMWTQQGWDLIF